MTLKKALSRMFGIPATFTASPEFEAHREAQEKEIADVRGNLRNSVQAIQSGNKLIEMAGGMMALLNSAGPNNEIAPGE